MLLPGTEIHPVVFIIILLEFALFLFQILSYLARPSDRPRCWFLLLLGFILYYNCVSGFLPDSSINIPIETQNIIAYSGGLLVSMYLPLYIFKVFQLTTLRFYAYWGSVSFLFAPFILCFIIPYYLTGNLDMSRRLVVIVPFLYALSFVYSLSKALISDYQRLKSVFSKEEIAGIFIAVVLWTALPIIVYFNGNQLLENSMVNAGFLFLSVTFIKKSIVVSRQEYNLLLSLNTEAEQSIILNINPWEKFNDLCISFNLTNRETEIIHLIGKGLTYKEIADLLHISEKTVARHIANIYFKTGVNKKAELLSKLEYPTL